jgi:fibronectin-binding autotransporter adhesin
MPFRRSVHDQPRRMPALRIYALTAVSTNVLMIAIHLPAHAQQVNAGAGETKTVPPFVMLASDTALFAHDGGSIQGTASTVATSGSYAHGGAAETGSTIELTGGAVTTDGMSAMGLYAFGAGSQIISSADVTTFGSGAHAAFARAGGLINLTGGRIGTSGSDAFGVLADGVGSRVESRASIDTSDPNSIGAAATAGGAINLTSGTIRTSGVAAYGLYSSGTQSVAQSAVNVSTAGDFSHGVLVQAGGSAALTAGTVTTTSRDAVGLLSEGVNSRITSTANVTTSGSGAVGILSRFAGFIEQIGGLITSTGTTAHGLFATGSESSINSTATVQTSGANAAGALADAGGSISLGGAIETTGASAPGLLSSGNGSAVSSTAQIITAGQDAYGAQAVNGGSVSLSGGTIRTSGDGAQGVRAVGIGSSINSSAQISVSGAQAAGVAAHSGGTVQLRGGSVTTTGSGQGLYAFGSGSTISGSADVATSADEATGALADGRGTVSLTGGTIRTSGSRSAGLSATYGSSAAIDNVGVTTSGLDSPGAYVTAASLAITNSQIDSSGAGVSSLGDATVQVSNSRVRGQAPVFDAVFDLAGQAATFNVLNSQLVGNTDLLRVTRGDNGRDGVVTITLEGSEAIGIVSDVEARTSGYTHIALTGGSRLSGGVNGIERLTLDRGTWRIAGPTRVSALEIGSSGATLDTAGQSISLGAPIEGVGELTKTGPGMLRLTGTSSLSGPTDIQAGTLAINGSLRNSSVRVGSGATLTGDGTIGGLVAQSGSTISPGAPTGTLAVNGDVRFLPGSVLALGIGSSGQPDRITASGQATLLGGSVQIVPDQGAIYRANTPYPILIASSVSGTFDEATGAEFAFVSPTLGYGDNAVFLTLTRRTDPEGSTFASVALTRNQRSTADAVEQLGAGQELFDRVLGASVSGARQAFNALSGEIHSSAVTAGYRDAQLVQNAILARLRQTHSTRMPSFTHGSYRTAYTADAYAGPSSALLVRSFDPRRFALWGEGFGSWGKVAHNGNAADLDTATGGFILGAESNLSERYRIGIAGGFTRTAFDVDARLSSGSNETVYGSLYSGASWGGFNARLGVSYASHDFDTQRAVRFPGFSDAVAASYGGWTAQAFAELAYRFELAPVAIEPFVSASILRAHTNRFDEEGGAAALTGYARDHDIGTTTIGIRAETRPSDAVPMLVRGMLGWRHAYGEVEPKALLAFRGAASAFTIWGAPLDRDTLVAEAGIYWQVSPNISLGATYEGQIGSHLQDHAIKGNLTAKF